MDDLWLRGLLVVIALGFGLSAAAVSRRRSHRRVSRATTLDPGVYLFSSETCSTCPAALEELAAVLGESGFREVSWQRDPGLFEDVGVDAVPTVVLVDTAQAATVIPGRPSPALWPDHFRQAGDSNNRQRPDS